MKICLSCGKPIGKNEPSRGITAKGSRFTVWRHSNPCKFQGCDNQDNEISLRLQTTYNLGRGKKKEARNK